MFIVQIPTLLKIMLHHNTSGHTILNNENMASKTASIEHAKLKTDQHHGYNNVKSRYELIKTLGKGTYGKVKLAIDRTNGQKV